MKAVVWRGIPGQWWVEWCSSDRYNPERSIRLRTPILAPHEIFPTHADALAYALRMVGLTPEEER